MSNQSLRVHYLNSIKAIGYIGKEGERLKKFKDTENSLDNVGQSRSMIYFQISRYTFLKKYPLLKQSTLPSSYLKSNFKAIKFVSKENLFVFLYSPDK